MDCQTQAVDVLDGIEIEVEELLEIPSTNHVSTRRCWFAVASPDQPLVGRGWARWGGLSFFRIEGGVLRDLVLINPLNHYSGAPSVNLGLLNIQAVVREAGYDVGILDVQRAFFENNCSFDPGLFKWLESLLFLAHSKVYGISTMNASYFWALTIARQLKTIYPDCVVCLGGPHISGIKRGVFEDTKYVDYIALYEGEVYFPDFLNYLITGKGDLPKNVLSRDGQGDFSMTSYKIDALPELDYSPYYSLPVVDVETGRGCPYNCYYCSSRSILGQHVRFHSIDRILRQAETVYGNMTDKDRLISFVHDNFLSSKEKFKRFAKAKIDGGYSFRYGCEGRIDGLDDEVIELLAASGCSVFFAGLESGSERIQAIARKGLDLSDTLLTVRKLLNVGVRFETNFIVGFPEETFDELVQSLTLAAKIALEGVNTRVDYSYMSPEPLTDVAKNCSVLDYVPVSCGQMFKDLVSCGVDISCLNPVHFNHLYSVRNEHYDVRSVVAKADLFFDLINNCKFTLYHMIVEEHLSVSDIFNRYCQPSSRCAAEQYLWDLEDDSVEKALVQYEVDRSYARDFVHSYTFLYQYSVQQLYKRFLETMSFEEIDSVSRKPTLVYVMKK